MSSPVASTSTAPPPATANGAPTFKKREKLTKEQQRAKQEESRKAKGQQASGSARQGVTSSTPALNGTSTSSSPALPSSSARPARPGQPPAAPEAPSDLLRRFFLHLDGAQRPTKPSKDHEIHPAVSRLALQYSAFKIVGANARCLAMLEAFKEVCLLALLHVA